MPQAYGRTERVPLTRERLLSRAVALADAAGITALTMRSLAYELGVKPMALYHHVAGKDEILDGIVDIVFDEIALPAPGGEWYSQIRNRSMSARMVLKAHPWAIPLLQSRTRPGTATLRHHNAFIATLRTAGFSVAMTAHAYALVDSYVFGFALSEASLPFNGPEDVPELIEKMAHFFSPDEYPYLLEMSEEHINKPGYDFGEEFEFGLDLILDGLAKGRSDQSGQ